MQKPKLIYIHGASGVGKTTLGNQLLQELRQIHGKENVILLDQDTFYKPNKPTIEYNYLDQNQQIQHVKEANWDTLQALDMRALNQAIEDGLSLHRFVIVTGFALRQYISMDPVMKYFPSVNILLDYNLPPEKAREKMIEARQKSKGYQGQKAFKDRKRVELVVWPYYEETLKLLEKPTKIKVFDEKGERISLKILSEELLKLCLD